MLRNKVTVLVSTVDKNILGNKDLVDLELSPELNMVVVNQMINDKTPLLFEKRFCKVVNDDGKGLSRSRNLALNEVISGIAVIADDDVKYVENFDKIIRESFEKNQKCGVLTYKIITPNGSFYKKYKSKPYFHDRFSIMKVSSISICLKIDNIRNNKIKFDEQFGLGSSYVSGEENIFLFDSLKRKIKLKYIPESIVIHPLESSGKKMNKELFYGKGALFRRIFGISGFCFFVIFCFLKMRSLEKSNLSFYKALLYSNQGFMSYSKAN